MDLENIISVCLLLLTTSHCTAIRIRCQGFKCIITDAKTSDDFFVLQYVTKRIPFVTIQNIQMEHLDTSLLNPLENKDRIISLEKSVALSQLSITTGSRIVKLQMKLPALRSIIFETNRHLQLLCVSHSSLVTVPSTIHNGIGLKKIEISHSAIRTFALTVFCDLPVLNVLLMNDNNLRSVLPSSQQVCKVYDSLERINLSNNLLRTVSMALFRPFVQLHALNLDNNLIRSLTGCFASDMLQELHVSNNKLKSFSLCQWRIPFLTILSLNSNRLTVLPACLDNLPSLKKLAIKCNRIFAFEISELQWLDNLKYIHLSSNRIRSITLNSSDFPMKLESLVLDHNNITELNLWFVPVVELHVQVEFNLISSFDINATSNNISRLSMKGNPMDCSWNYPEERTQSKCYRNT